jgi:poly(3-hydroxybutyrate) depolymerase
MERKGKGKKIILGALVIVFGLPVTIILTAFACSYTMDRTNGAIVSSGVTRRYRLYVPKTYDRSRPTPLLISLHGGALWPAAEMAISRWNHVADEQGFLVVYPAGSGAFLVDSARVRKSGPWGHIVWDGTSHSFRI